MSNFGYAISPANFYGWDYKRDSARDLEINEAVDDRIHDLGSASGHGDDEQALMEQVLNNIAESDDDYRTLKRYLFEIWRQRNVQTTDDKRRKDRASQAIANLLGGVVLNAITAEVRKDFVDA